LVTWVVRSRNMALCSYRMFLDFVCYWIPILSCTNCGRPS